MAKFCMKCGTPIPEGVNFCPNCGLSISQKQTPPVQQPPPTYQQPQQQTPPPQQPPPTYQQSPPPQQTYQQQTPPPQQPYYGQTQPYAPTPKKSHIKLIIGIVAIVIAIVVILLVVFFVLGGSDDRFVGKWEQESVVGSIEWEFESDGDFKLSGTKAGTWEKDGDQLCIKYTDSAKMCYDVKFKNNDKTLELSIAGITLITLNKK